MTDKLLTPQELADILGVKKSTIYYWSHIKYIPVVKLGRNLRFRQDSIAKWLDRLESKGRLKQKQEFAIDKELK